MPRSSLHSLSHTRNISLNMGQMIPISCIEALPGDRWRHSVSALLRTQPLLAPLYHTCHVYIRHYFVPNRIMWNASKTDSWEAFITGGEQNNLTPSPPMITLPNAANGGVTSDSLARYLKVPLGANADGTGFTVSALPFRAISLIWNHYYRDEQLENERAVSYAGGADTTTDTSIPMASWEKDYFTTCRPQPQLGSSVSIPLLGTAPVMGIGVTSGSPFGSSPANQKEADGTTNNWSFGRSVTDGSINIKGDSLNGYPDVQADLTGASAFDIRDFRLFSSLQRWRENISRFGNRYKERLMAAFGVQPQDSRLDWPEYLGGGRSTINFSEVLQTADNVVEGEVADMVGTMRGHGMSVARSNRYRFFVPEHGWIVSLMFVLPKTMYTQGIPRSYTRMTKEDYYQPELESIGQQEVFMKELYASATDPDGIFGYQDRYDEYRREEDSVAGDFDSTLDYWHMARIFSAEPSLNSTFVRANPTNRVYPTSEHQLMVRCFSSIQTKRRVPRVARNILK